MLSFYLGCLQGLVDAGILIARFKPSRLEIANELYRHLLSDFINVRFGKKSVSEGPSKEKNEEEEEEERAGCLPVAMEGDCTGTNTPTTSYVWRVILPLLLSSSMPGFGTARRLSLEILGYFF